MTTSNTQPGRVTLVGTNHLSERSSASVRSAIRRADPDIVAVELGPSRAAELQGDGSNRLLETANLIRSNGLLTAGINLGLEMFYESADTPTDGGDMVVGTRTAAALDCQVALIDRDIQDTLPAIADGARSDIKQSAAEARARAEECRDLVEDGDWTGVAHLVAEHYRQTFSQSVPIVRFFHRASEGEMPPKELRDALSDAMDEKVPETMDGLLHTRDDILAGHLHSLRSSGHSVVAVLGALHVSGVEERLKEPERIPDEAIAQPVTKSPDDFRHLV